MRLEIFTFLPSKYRQFHTQGQATWKSKSRKKHVTSLGPFHKDPSILHGQEILTSGYSLGQDYKSAICFSMTRFDTYTDWDYGNIKWFLFLLLMVHSEIYLFVSQILSLLITSCQQLVEFVVDNPTGAFQTITGNLPYYW